MLIPISSYSGEFEIKKSRFIYTALPVSSSEEVKSHIHAKRKEHPKANHVVHAFIIGKEQEVFGMSDDREPKNTAGRPALEVLKGSNITNILVTIVRYFGGTKLGTGGLVKAYGEAAKRAVEAVSVEKLVDKQGFRILLPYPFYNQTKLLLQQHHAELTDEVFETEVTITGIIPEKHIEDIRFHLEEISSGTITIELHPMFPQNHERKQNN